MLVYAGHDVDHLLDTYSLQQLGAHAGWVMRYQVEMLNLVLGPLAQMQGVDWKPHKPGTKKSAQHRDPKHHRSADFDTDSAKEKALEIAMSRRFRVKTIKTSDPGGSDGEAGPG